MNELLLRYTRDDPPNACGPLEATVQTHGFCGHGETYVAEAWLVRFAEQLRVFPLPVQGVMEDLLIGEDTGLTIKFVANGSLGRLVLQVSIRGLIGDLAHRVDAQLVTDYASVERFSRELVAAANAGEGEARIAA